MPYEFLQSPWGGVFWIFAVIAALTFHEFFHALVAYSLGDQTPKDEGRVTLFPFPHIDPLGFFLLLFFGFGWAKPVRFEPDNLKSRRFGSTLVAFAGPIANGIFFILTLAAAKLIESFFGGKMPLDAVIFFKSLLVINTLLFVVNFIPLPPFDGSKLLLDLLQIMHLDKIKNFLQINGQYVAVALMALDSFVGPGLISHLVFGAISWADKLI